MARNSIAEKITLLPTDRRPRRWGTTAALARIAARFHIRIKKQAIEIERLCERIIELNEDCAVLNEKLEKAESLAVSSGDLEDIARALAKGKRGRLAEAIDDLDHVFQRIDTDAAIRTGAVPVII